MQMQPVQSSNIAAIGYDPATSDLLVEFHNGSTYRYYGVPANVFDDLQNAGSVGRYFMASIRNSYKFTEE